MTFDLETYADGVQDIARLRDEVSKVKGCVAIAYRNSLLLMREGLGWSLPYQTEKDASLLTALSRALEREIEAQKAREHRPRG